jgi:hypothetical protein
LGNKDGVGVVSVANATTASKCEARLMNTLSMQGKEAGLTIDTLPCVNGKAIDLTALLVSSEFVTNTAGLGDAGSGPILVRTNLSAAIRVQLTNGEGILLVDANPERRDRKRLGVLISAQVLSK